MALKCVVALALLSVAAAVDVSPIEKVIDLIEGLKKEVESDGKSEAKAYKEFACFCKDTSGAKSKSVEKEHKHINVLSADIADKTQQKEDDISEVAERQGKQQAMSQKLDETIARCAQQKAEYTAEEADLSKAIQGLKDAIKSMKDSKPASFLEIRQSLDLAEAMNLLKTPKHKAVSALIQTSASVDPSDPEFKFHSNDIIELCEQLLDDYKASKKDLDDEWKKTDEGCKSLKKSLREKMSANADAIKAKKKNIEKLKTEVAEHRGDLVIAESQMKDDEQYLNDLTARCQDRANDYDQRSSMRNGELNALKEALGVLKKDVKGRANAVNQRALLQNAAHKEVAPVAAAKVSAPVVQKAISFLQGSSTNAQAREVSKEKALDLLKKEGNRLKSFTLLSLAQRAAADPFKKVKGLIQKLIERLLTESRNEATKKGFCDTELGKARKDRDNRYEESQDLSAELHKLEAKEDALKEEIKQLQKDIKDETKALKDATKDRKDEKGANAKTLKTAKEGLDSVNEALLVLKSFYKQAAKASLLQASPVDEDTSGPGFSGNYKGNQGASSAIFALLETIASDFDRTLRTTEEAEHNAHREYVQYSQDAKSSIAGKSTKQELDEQDLKSTRTSLKTKMDDLQTAVDLLDKALQELEELKPTCIDTGMSYSERVAKREEEIKALNNAFDILS